MSASLVLADRIRNGDPAQVEITASYQDLGPSYGLPWMFLFSCWSARKGDYRCKDAYRCEEIPAAGGRAFLLWRSEQIIAHDVARAKPGDPEVPVRYGCFLANEQDCQCECRGFEAHGRCKHIDALKALLAGGHIESPHERPSYTVLQIQESARKPDPVANMTEAPF
jgi:hypothetical protein